ncbi:MAG: glucose 1-dehydrogenase [Chloroflexi bacterium]|nr:glucose 1-dehydrogenase [Chloroflexota bacterium]
MGRLDGKTAIITGAARGQGADEALLFALEGANVVFGDVLDDEGMAVERQIREIGGNASYVRLDVTSDDDWSAAVELAEERFGSLDIVVNNAAINLPSDDRDAWDKMMDVNVRGVHLGTQHSIPAMKRAGGGSIVNISSVAGLLGRKGTPYAYTASKGAVRLLTKAVAIDYAADNIRCNSIHPGPIDTEMLAGTTPTAEAMEVRRHEVPLQRIGVVRDIALAVLFLASDESSWITGAELAVDGGITAQ